MSIKDKYKVQPIDAFQCKEWLMYKHYARRIPNIEYSFGLYENTILLGVCTFGTPPRVMNNGQSIFKDYTVKTLELNRLCINDGLEKNTLSYFLSKCLDYLPKPSCIVSYADYSFGHNGYIYQATNWIYTGLNQIHEREIFWHGKEIHPRTACSLGYTNISEWAKNDNNVVLGEYTKKHRYIKFMGNKKEIKTMANNLVYKIQPYPKGDNKRYDASYMPNVQINLF